MSYFRNDMYIVHGNLQKCQYYIPKENVKKFESINYERTVNEI